MGPGSGFPQPQNMSAKVEAEPTKADATSGRGERSMGPGQGGTQGPRGSRTSLGGHVGMGYSASAGKSGPGGTSGPVDLRQIHYDTMRRLAAQRAKQKEERETKVDRDLETERPKRRPASASAVSSSRRANNESQAASSRQAGTSEPAGGKIGGLRSFVESGAFPTSAGPAFNAGYPDPLRKPFTSIPGYGGYIPKKVPDNITGCTFNRGNVLARGAYLCDPSPWVPAR